MGFLINLLRKIVNETQSESQQKTHETTSILKETNDEKAARLLREATALKESDIELAIEDIREAIRLGSENYDKLSSYLFYAGRVDEAIAVYKDVLIPKERKRELPYNAMGSIYQKLASLYYRNNNFEEYFYYSSLSCFYYITHNFTFESIEMVKHFYDSKTPISYTGQPNFQRALKKIGKSNIYEEFEKVFMKFFFDLKEKIYDAAKTDAFLGTAPRKIINQRFSIFTEELFSDFYKKNLLILLK